MFFKLNERPVRRASITLPIGIFLRNNGLQLRKIRLGPNSFVLSRLHPKKGKRYTME